VRPAPDAVEVLIADDRLDDTQPLLAALEDEGERPQSVALATAGRCRTTLLAHEGDLGSALEVFEQALTEHERAASLQRTDATRIWRHVRRARGEPTLGGDYRALDASCTRCGRLGW
jgi:hypothetical protein